MERSERDSKAELSREETTKKVVDNFDIKLDKATIDAGEKLNKELTSLSVETWFRRFTI